MIWQHRTRKGIFYIRLMPSGLFGIIFDDECLGEYPHPAQSAHEIANGLSFLPNFGDPTELGIPEDLDDWERIG